jgi:hypothetical protein
MCAGKKSAPLFSAPINAVLTAFEDWQNFCLRPRRGCFCLAGYLFSFDATCLSLLRFSFLFVFAKVRSFKDAWHVVVRESECVLRITRPMDLAITVPAYRMACLG